MAADERRTAEIEWRRLQESRHVENVARFRLLDERLRLIDQHITNDKQEKAAMRASIEDNAKLAQSIKADTAALVALYHVTTDAAVAFRRFILWFLPIASSLATAFAAYVTFFKK